MWLAFAGTVVTGFAAGFRMSGHGLPLLSILVFALAAGIAFARLPVAASLGIGFLCMAGIQIGYFFALLVRALASRHPTAAGAH